MLAVSSTKAKEKRSCEVLTTSDKYPMGCSADGCFLEYIREWFEFMIIAIVIIVVAVPEGLPLAVMISLAFSISAMLKDDCDVKKLASCEIMGGAN
jgi:magnesium-transporting ATPase (P-type)